MTHAFRYLIFQTSDDSPPNNAMTHLERRAKARSSEIHDHGIDVHKDAVDDTLREAVLTGGVLVLVGGVLAGTFQRLHLDLHLVQVLANGQARRSVRRIRGGEGRGGEGRGGEGRGGEGRGGEGRG